MVIFNNHYTNSNQPSSNNEIKQEKFSFNNSHIFKSTICVYYISREMNNIKQIKLRGNIEKKSFWIFTERILKNTPLSFKTYSNNLIKIGQRL